MSELSFYSIDRLVEFGLGLGVATQMAQSMNAALKEMCVPGAGNSLETVKVPADSARVGEAAESGLNVDTGTQTIYYVARDGNALGPLSVTELTRLITEKRVTKETYVWIPGMADWRLAEYVPEVLRLAALTPPPLPESTMRL